MKDEPASILGVVTLLSESSTDEKLTGWNSKIDSLGFSAHPRARDPATAARVVGSTAQFGTCQCLICADK